MPSVHIVKQGEHLSRIAKEFGFSDYRTIWNHSQNAELKQKRLNPNVLHSGDSLFIPDKALREEDRPTDKLHSFVMKRPSLKLRLIVEDQYQKPIANAPCILAIDADSREITTDGEGKIEEDIPADADNGRLIIQNAQDPSNSIQIPIFIGHLDPLDEVSGQRARLTNLGYLARSESTGDSSDEFKSAVEEFQCENNLTVDGICGPMTQAKLKQVHGC